MDEFTFKQFENMLFVILGRIDNISNEMIELRKTQVSMQNVLNGARNEVIDLNRRASASEHKSSAPRSRATKAKTVNHYLKEMLEQYEKFESEQILEYIDKKELDEFLENSKKQDPEVQMKFRTPSGTRSIPKVVSGLLEIISDESKKKLHQLAEDMHNRTQQSYKFLQTEDPKVTAAIIDDPDAIALGPDVSPA